MTLSADVRRSQDASLQPLVHSAIVLLLGFCAGMQLGKIAPIVGYFQQTHGYSLTVIGWLTALLGLFVALAAIPTARFVDRVGSVGALKTGAIILTVGALLLSLVGTLPLHLAARAIEAVGYVLVVVAAPAYLATHARPAHRPSLLALWGSFVPVGYALANLQAGLVSNAFNPKTSLLTAALLLAALTLVVVLVIRSRSLPIDTADGAEPSHTERTLHGTLRNAILLSVGFCIYVILQMAFFTFMPTFMDSMHEASVSPAVIALFVPAGNLTAAFLLGVLNARASAVMAVFSMAFTALTAIFLFRPDAPPAAFAYIAFALLGGIMASCVFGSIPQAASKRLSAAMVVGMIAQGGGLGTIGGPPLAGYLVDHFGWHGLSWLLGLLAAAGAVVLLPLVNPFQSGT